MLNIKGKNANTNTDTHCEYSLAQIIHTKSTQKICANELSMHIEEAI